MAATVMQPHGTVSLRGCQLTVRPFAGLDPAEHAQIVYHHSHASATSIGALLMHTAAKNRLACGARCTYRKALKCIQQLARQRLLQYCAGLLVCALSAANDRHADAAASPDNAACMHNKQETLPPALRTQQALHQRRQPFK